MNIPNNNPPQLTSEFSKGSDLNVKYFIGIFFKIFEILSILVSIKILLIDPPQRLVRMNFSMKYSIFKDLLRHKFIKNAKKTSILVDPINKYQKWKSKNPKDQSDDDDPSEEINSTVRVSSKLELFNMLKLKYQALNGLLNLFSNPRWRLIQNGISKILFVKSQQSYFHLHQNLRELFE